MSNYSLIKIQESHIAKPTLFVAVVFAFLVVIPEGDLLLLLQLLLSVFFLIPQGREKLPLPP
jgi:hypothetical protein